MSDKEDYLPLDASIEDIDRAIYTDNERHLDSVNALLSDEEIEEIEAAEASTPPFDDTWPPF